MTTLLGFVGGFITALVVVALRLGPDDEENE